MIACKNVYFSYASNEIEENNNVKGTLKDISCTIEDGSFVLLCGNSGCGKTTLTRLFNGLIPHYYDGELSGNVLVDGVEYKDFTLFDISGKVGSVFQNPRAQFFNVDTNSELAFAPENHGWKKQDILKRVAEVVEQLNLNNLLDRSIFSLSGGEKQKIACGSATAINPEIYVFDEPSSNLDSTAIAELRALLKILKENGKTIIIAEHRLYYLYDLVDKVFYLKDGEIKGDYTGQEFRAMSYFEREELGLRPCTLEGLKTIESNKRLSKEKVWEINNFHFSYKNSQTKTLCIDKVTLAFGEVTAIIGKNGAGKTTFSRCLCGLEKRCKGTLEHSGIVYSTKQRLKQCYMVMQDVNHQLFTESVLEEVLLSMEKEDSDKAEEFLAEMDLLPLKECHPMSLSGGQKQRVAIASAVASQRPIIIFDEPTSGLDLFHMRQVSDCVNRLADKNKTVIVVTHDPEFILHCCDHVIHMENGYILENYSLKEQDARDKVLDFFSVEHKNIERGRLNGK